MLLLLADYLGLPIAAIMFIIVFIMNLYANNEKDKRNAVYDKLLPQIDAEKVARLEVEKERDQLSELVLLLKNSIPWQSAIERVAADSKTAIISFFKNIKPAPAPLPQEKQPEDVKK
jgi:ATP-dependent Zn protease